jgi:lysozyme family protein
VTKAIPKALWLTAALALLFALPALGAAIPCRPGEIPEFPDRLHQKLFDTAVNAGHSRAVKLLQQALNDAGGARLAADGRIGPKTRAAICGLDENAVLRKYAERQAAFYRGIVARKPSQAKFLKGWLRRAAWLPPEKTDR